MLNLRSFVARSTMTRPRVWTRLENCEAPITSRMLSACFTATPSAPWDSEEADVLAARLGAVLRDSDSHVVLQAHTRQPAAAAPGGELASLVDLAQVLLHAHNLAPVRTGRAFAPPTTRDDRGRGAVFAEAHLSG